MPDEAATARLAEDIAAVLRPGDLVALSGGLGAGKTTFARALIRALAADPALRSAEPDLPAAHRPRPAAAEVVHADLYRLGAAGELDEIGLDEALADGAAAGRMAGAAAAGSRRRTGSIIAFEIAGDGRRARRFAAPAPGRRGSRARLRDPRFLDRAGWRGATRVPLAGDASVPRLRADRARRARRAILMNAPARPEGPPVHGGRSYDAVAHRALDVRPFVAIDLALREAGIRAPEIHAADIDAGLLLLEDLGGEGDPRRRRRADPRALRGGDRSARLHARPRTGRTKLPLPDGDTLPPAALRPRGAARRDLAVSGLVRRPWRRAGLSAASSADDVPGGLVGRARRRSSASETTWVLRDFHSPNILWQAERERDSTGSASSISRTR